MATQVLTAAPGANLQAQPAPVGSTLVLYIPSSKGPVSVWQSGNVVTLDNPGSPIPKLAVVGRGEIRLSWIMQQGAAASARVTVESLTQPEAVGQHMVLPQHAAHSPTGHQGTPWPGPPKYTDVNVPLPASSPNASLPEPAAPVGYGHGLPPLGFGQGMPAGGGGYGQAVPAGYGDGYGQGVPAGYGYGQALLADQTPSAPSMPGAAASSAPVSPAASAPITATATPATPTPSPGLMAAGVAAAAGIAGLVTFLVMNARRAAGPA